MDIKINKLYEMFLHAQKVGFDYGLTFSLRKSPKLKEFLSDLDPELPLDWSAKSFYGMPELRQRVVETQGYNVPADNLLITAGTNEANFLILTQTVSKGDEIVMDMPSWPQIYELATAYGANVKIVKRREELGWGLDLDELKKAVSPQNETGFYQFPKQSDWGRAK